MSETTIRDYAAESDLETLRASMIELQDFERELDERMPEGRSIVDEYVPQMVERCIKYDGKIMIAEVNGKFAGYVSIWSNVPSEELEDGDLVYGYVADLFVHRAHRGRGLGRALLQAAEAYARDKGVEWLRIGVLASNRSAHGLYRSAGFSDYSVELEKDLRGKPE